MSDNDNETPSTETKGQISKIPEKKSLKAVQSAAKVLFRWGMWALSIPHTVKSFATMVKRLIAFIREMSDAS